jgi:esterase/lipase superfamily enzyme
VLPGSGNDGFEKGQQPGVPAFQLFAGKGQATESAVHLAVQVANKMNYTGDVVVFAWPSLGSLSPANYVADAAAADASKAAFSQLLAALQASQPVDRIDVIAHSLGNRVVIRALLAADAPAKLGQLVLCSPDVERTEFKQSIPKITSLLKGATLWASNNDNALLVAPTFGGGEARAGLIEAGGEPIVLPQLATIDVSHETALFALNHNAYIQVSDLFTDLAQVFDPGAIRPWLNPAKRDHYIPTQTTDTQTYWKYMR